ncbi:MAG: hypothetical protein JWQ57_2904 [Mucilaginibacter sp.]|nr:hypothetical protein [Mucilaginibacter sp.]
MCFEFGCIKSVHAASVFKTDHKLLEMNYKHSGGGEITR